MPVELRKAAELSEGVGPRLAFAPDGRTWASASSTLLQVWRDQELEHSVPSPGELLDGLRFDRNGSKLLVSPHVFELDSHSWTQLPSLDAALRAGLDQEAEPGGFAPHGGAWGPDGRNLVVYAEYRPPRGVGASSSYRGPSKRLLLLDGRLRELLGVLWESKGWEGYRAVAVDDRHIAAAGVGGGLWRLANQERTAELKQHSGTVRQLAFSPDGALLASVGADKQLVLWDVAAGTAIRSWTAHEEDAWAVAFHPSEPLLATGGWDDVVRLWSLDGERQGEEPAGDHVDGVAFSPAGDRLLAARSGPEPALIVYELGR